MVTLLSSSSVLRRRAAAAAVVAGALAVSMLGASPSVSVPAPESAQLPTSAVARGSLTVTPDSGYVAGQGLRFTGSLGKPGKRTLSVQYHMNRPGDRWTVVPWFTAKSQADGSFDFAYPSPAMRNISLRVVGGKAATQPFRFAPITDDIALSYASAAMVDNAYVVLPGQSYTLTAQATSRFAGRTFTLQRRSGTTWSTVAALPADANGLAVFTVTSGDVGTEVYRVRQEDFASGGYTLGWNASFPLYVPVVATMPVSTMPVRPTRTPKLPPTPVITTVPPAPTPTLPTATSPTVTTATSTATAPSVPTLTPAPTQSPTLTVTPVPTPNKALTPAAPSVLRRAAAASAASRYGWGPTLWDFAWEYGESLTSPPYRGTSTKGWWQELATGTGRATKANGQLMVQSGPGESVGSTSVTLRDNAATTGRYEVQLRWLGTGNAHHLRLELVPDSLSDTCGAHSITIGDIDLAAPSTYVIGVANGTSQWSATRPLPRVGQLTLSLEVGAKHLTWYAAGKPVGTVEDRAALPTTPMTLRVSVVGDEAVPTGPSTFIADWLRAYPLTGGREVKNAPRLSQGAFTGGCPAQR